MSGPVVALMVVISVISSQTPPQFGDRLHVIVTPYESLQACVDDLVHNPLREEEMEVEKKYSLKTVRSCTKLEDTDYHYDWSTKAFTDWDGNDLKGVGVIESGPVTDR